MKWRNGTAKSYDWVGKSACPWLRGGVGHDFRVWVKQVQVLAFEQRRYGPDLWVIFTSQLYDFGSAIIAGWPRGCAEGWFMGHCDIDGFKHEMSRYECGEL